MKNRKGLWEFVMAFLVCTACITLLEGIVGMLFFPQQRFGYEAFFSPPLFSFFSVLFGLIVSSEKELSVKQVLLRRGLHLLLIEGMVFGLNYISGTTFTPLFAGALAFLIALVFGAVYGVMWWNDRTSALLFNGRLRAWQSGQENISLTRET